MKFSHASVLHMMEEDTSRKRVAACLDAFFVLEDLRSSAAPTATRSSFIKCHRKPVQEIFAELGPCLTCRAYQMTEASFWFLLDTLEPFMKTSSETNDSNQFKKKHRNGAKNSFIPSETRLSVALRFFAGGRPDDIMLVHGISFVKFYKSLWAVVDAVNSCDNPAIDFSYPSDHEKQREIASEFHSKSNDCCAGAIDQHFAFWQSEFGVSPFLRRERNKSEHLE